MLTTSLSVCECVHMCGQACRGSEGGHTGANGTLRPAKGALGGGDEGDTKK